VAETVASLPMKSVLVRMVLVAAPWLVFSPSVQAQLTFTALGDLPGGTGSIVSEVLALSANGTVAVGYSQSAAGYEAIRWTQGGGMVSLGDLAGGTTNAFARAVSSDGSVIAGAGTSASGTESFRWTSGTGLTGLGDLTGGAFASTAYAISADGSVVAGTGNSSTSQAYRWTSGGGMVGLGYLAGGSTNISQVRGISADGSVIVGFSSSSTGSGQEAFRWTEGGGMVGLGLLAGGSLTSAAHAVSADGTTIVGQSYNASTQIEAIRWTQAGGMVGLGDLPGGSVSSTAYGVSGNGAIVVGYSQAASGNEAFYWTATSGMVSLQSYLTGQGVDLTGWTLRYAWAISSDGSTIAGSGLHNGYTEGFIVSGLNLTAVPEPSTYAVAAGITALGAAIWRKRRSRG
jgi:probable HAF family extracellular repeat protein